MTSSVFFLYCRPQPRQTTAGEAALPGFGIRWVAGAGGAPRDLIRQLLVPWWLNDLDMSTEQ